VTAAEWEAESGIDKRKGGDPIPQQPDSRVRPPKR
jgi:hypothetical protein